MLRSMFFKTKFILAGMIVLGAVLLPAASVQPAVAAPVDVLKQCDDPSSDSSVCKNRDQDGNKLPDLLTNVINLLLMIIGIISVIMIIIGGFRYTTSAGDAGQTKSARDTVIYAIVGLVIAIMSYALVNFVLNRLEA